MTSLSFQSTHLLILDAVDPAPGHGNTGVALADRLKNSYSGKAYSLGVKHFAIPDVSAFEGALNAAIALARVGGLPMIHFDGHADETGLRAANNAIFPWSRLWPLLKQVNIQCKNNLCITLGVCKGLRSILDAEYSILKAAPALAIVGAQNKVAEETVGVGFELFFEKLFVTGSVDAAFEELKAIDEERLGGYFGDYRLSTAQVLFERSAAMYIVRQCMGSGAQERIERLIRDERFHGRGKRKARQTLRSNVRGPQALRLKKYHEKFLMIDPYPELQGRLSMDYLQFEKWVKSEHRKGRAVF